MNHQQRIAAFVQLGEIFKHIAQQKEWPGYGIGLNEEEYGAFQDVVSRAFHHNGWFTESNVRLSLEGIASWLEQDQLKNLQDTYDVKEISDKTVGIVMAGNIPLVGFHDVMCVIMSGHSALIKLSKDDTFLWKAVLRLMRTLDKGFNEIIKVVDIKMTGYDAIIATGSDNSLMYFKQYFGKVPHIFRKNRTSVAVLHGSESKEELRALGQDIFQYFGLGCRNVSKILTPEGYNLDGFFQGVFEHKELINHTKYANNYDYHKAIYLMNKDEILDNGFVILKESNDLHSPLGVLYHQKFEDRDGMNQYIQENKESLQCVIGKDYLPFGTAQKPGVLDFADGVDTMAFLSKL